MSFKTSSSVSQSLLNQYPDTMLARMASDTWRDNNNNNNVSSSSLRPLFFIDRDSTLFRYILQYMRDQLVTLPLTESKPSSLRELTYYGVENVDSDCIIIGCLDFFRHDTTFLDSFIEYSKQGVVANVDSWSHKVEEIKKLQAYSIVAKDLALDIFAIISKPNPSNNGGWPIRACKNHREITFEADEPTGGKTPPTTFSYEYMFERAEVSFDTSFECDRDHDGNTRYEKVQFESPWRPFYRWNQRTSSPKEMTYEFFSTLDEDLFNKYLVEGSAGFKLTNVSLDRTYYGPDRYDDVAYNHEVRTFILELEKVEKTC